MAKIVLLRHGISRWNQLNIFTGWVDVPLCAEGIEEALRAGDALRDIEFNVVFTSRLMRASMTAVLALSRSRKVCCPTIVHKEKRYEIPEGVHILPIYEREALNERHYGDLQGKNKDQVKNEVGEEKFRQYRRSFAIRPPGGESLKDTIERMMPCFKEEIIPCLEEGNNVLVSAHGNSIRGFLKVMDDISDESIVSVEVPTGIPIIYDYQGGLWQRIKA